MDTNFNINDFRSQLNAAQAKRDEFTALQAAVLEKEQAVLAARQAKQAETKRLLAFKDTLDLRRVAKQDRVSRTYILREAGIILPNEEICKVREPRHQ